MSDWFRSASIRKRIRRRSCAPTPINCGRNRFAGIFSPDRRTQSLRSRVTDSNSQLLKAKNRGAGRSTAHVLSWSIAGERFEVITTRWRRTALPNCSPTRTIFCASSRSELNRRLRMMRIGSLRANLSQILAVFSLGQSVDQPLQLRVIDEVLSERDFFQTGNFQALTVLDGSDVIAGFEQARLRARVEPGHAAGQRLYMQFVAPRISELEFRDFQLAASGGF